MSAPTVLLTGSFHRDGLDVLRPSCTVATADSIDPAWLLTRAPDFDAVVVRANVQLDRNFFQQASRLRVVGRFGVGIDNIDVEAAHERGVFVVNAPSANSASVVEHALACMLALARRLPEHDRHIREGDWAVRDRALGRELTGRVLGVVGLGAIGSAFARACQRALGMKIVYHDAVEHPDISSELGARRVELFELLDEADVVTLHVPLTPATRNLIDAAALSRLKPEAVLMNFARGGVVDERALCEALLERRLSGAALDVFEEEPLPAASPLLTAPNLILTPHAAGLSEEANSRVSVQIARDIIAVLEGRQPRHSVPRPTAASGLPGPRA